MSLYPTPYPMTPFAQAPGASSYYGPQTANYGGYTQPTGGGYPYTGNTGGYQAPSYGYAYSAPTAPTMPMGPMGGPMGGPPYDAYSPMMQPPPPAPEPQAPPTMQMPEMQMPPQGAEGQPAVASPFDQLPAAAPAKSSNFGFSTLLALIVGTIGGALLHRSMATHHDHDDHEEEVPDAEPPQPGPAETSTEA
jgi:hypothetical protein